VVTIDTEPDNQWDMPAGGVAPPLTFANTRGLGRLVDFLRGLGVRATWLTSYSVARDRESVQQLRAAAEQGDEIGGHLHAWETPPLTDADARGHGYIYEYEERTRREKLRHLNAALEEAFGDRPASYRAGRWGIDDLGYRHLEEQGYAIDSSVVPGHTFHGSPGIGRGGPDFRSRLTGRPAAPYRIGRLWEVPVSTTTIGGLGSGPVPAALARAVWHSGGIAARVARKTLTVSRLTRLVWVRPLAAPRDDLVRAALSLLSAGAPVINVMFHSSEAYPGTSPKTRTREGVDRFYGDLDAVVRTLMGTGRVVPSTLRESVPPDGAP